MYPSNSVCSVLCFVGTTDSWFCFDLNREKELRADLEKLNEREREVDPTATTRYYQN